MRQVMEHERENGLEIDKVSRWILTLAAGMVVLGAAFAVLDWYGLLPQLPAATVAHDPRSNSGPESKGHG
jgi:hypothetical protein